MLASRVSVDTIHTLNRGLWGRLVLKARAWPPRAVHHVRLYQSIAKPSIPSSLQAEVTSDEATRRERYLRDLLRDDLGDFDELDEPLEDEEADDWASITALEESRQKLDWRKQLVDESSWDRESDLDQPQRDQSERLINLHASDLELWEGLLLYRLKHYGDDGGKMIWRHMNQSVVSSPMRIWERPKVWKAILKLALEDSELLNELISHCTSMAAVFADKPDYFYKDVMKSALLKNDPRTLSWHEALKSLQPSKSDIRKLFTAIHDDPWALRSFETFCFDLTAFSGMYAHIVPRLCQSGLKTEAFSWHELLLRHHDVPSGFDVMDKTLSDLARQGSSFLAHKMALGLHHAGVQGGRRWLREPMFEETGLQSVEKSDHTTLTEVGFHDLPTTKFSDSFVARLIATAFFSIESILAGLHAIHVTGVGPLAFRQLIFRIAIAEQDTPKPEFEPAHIAKAAAYLQQANLELHSSTFSYVLIEVAENGEHSALQSLLESDQHPDVLEDVELQESLLARYVERGSRTDITRTLAILKAIKGEAYSTARKADVANLQLFQAIESRDKTASLAILQEIIGNHSFLDSNILSGVFYEFMFSPRRRSRPPETFKELDHVTNFMMSLQRSGYVVPLRAWYELIKRRAWEVNIVELERLLGWLFSWITDRRFRLALTYSDAKPIDWDRYYTSWAENMGEGTASYLERLFDKKIIIYLVKVGFKSDAKARHQDLLSSTQRVLSGTHEEKVRALVNDKSMWGLRFLASLRDKGLTFDDDVVHQICTHHLTILFGPGMPISRSERRMQALRKANWTDYAAAMETIWGKALFILSNDNRKLKSLPIHSLTSSQQVEMSRLTRLQQVSMHGLRRVSLRARLLEAHKLQLTQEQGENVDPRRTHTNLRSVTRQWRNTLPPVDTEEYLATLIPQLSPTGVLEDDPLLDTTTRERIRLIAANFRSEKDEPPTGFYNRYEDSQVPKFDPWIEEPNPETRPWREVFRLPHLRNPKQWH